MGFCLCQRAGGDGPVEGKKLVAEVRQPVCHTRFDTEEEFFRVFPLEKIRNHFVLKVKNSSAVIFQLSLVQSLGSFGIGS